MTKKNLDSVDRGSPINEDELQDRESAIELYPVKNSLEFAERLSATLDDAQQAEDIHNNEMSDPRERGRPLLDNDQQSLEEQGRALPSLAEEDADLDKRDSLFDMFKDISDRLDDIQEQVDELKHGKKLGNSVFLYDLYCMYFV